MENHTKNKIYMIVAYALRWTATLCSSGSLIQTFLKVIGFSSEFVYMHSTLIQAATVLTIMLCARWADRGSIIKRAALTQIPNGILFFLYIPICISRSASVQAYVFLLVIGILQSIAVGLHSVCEYKLPYFVYKKEEYATVTGICGVVASFLSFGAGALVSALSTKYDYIDIMFMAFIVSALCLVIAAVFTAALKVISNAEEAVAATKKENVPLLTVFMHPTFRGLFLPNFLRGISAGIITVLAVTAFDLGFDETVTTAMVSVQSIAGLVGCVWFTFASRRISSRIWIFFGNLLLILIPVLALAENSMVFLGIYFIIVFGRTLVDYAVPVALLYVVPVEIAGVYHAWRIALNNGGMLVATMIATVLPARVLLVIGAACALYSGVSYLLFPELRKAMPFYCRKD